MQFSPGAKRIHWLLLSLPMFALGGVARADEASDLARYDRLIKPADREHWSFQPVKRPSLPTVRDLAWGFNPIDRFILAKLEAKDLKPAPAAEPRALLRRLYLDLIGLPPTPAEQDAFLRDPSPQALERVIEDLLARPQYGERWGRHWLDLVRYAETNGYERDALKPHVWRYRDYVIRAFNEDRPFDRFIVEQLAGDELDDANAETLLATGYYRLGPWDDEPADPKEDRFDQLDDMVATTAQVFLGLTLNCARCHDHKFDPLTTLDYYRMVAIFNTLQRPQEGRTEVDLPVGPRLQVAAQLERERQTAGLEAALLGWRTAGPHASLLLGAGRLLEQAIRRPPELPRGYILEEEGPEPPVTHILLRGQASRPGPRVQPGMPMVLVDKQPVYPPAGPYTSRRRLTLARWLASPRNPLTARVLVNRIWQFHFGVGLVRTPSDYGVLGEQPTHPELLDWLADRFVQDGWSIKKLHRLILTSSTYRMSKRANLAYLASDPENQLWWRFPYCRLEVEAIRDSVLAVSGQLNSKMYGPSMYPHIAKAVLEGNSDPDKIWKESDEREAARRTVYATVKRSMLVPLLEVLDVCDNSRSTAKRNITSVAPQALTLFNGDFVNREAEHFAERLAHEAEDEPEKQIELGYRLALCRPPTASERTALMRFLQQETDALVADKGLDPTEARRLALVQVCRVIFNLNEFVYPD